MPVEGKGGGWWMRQEDDDFSKHGDGENLFFRQLRWMDSFFLPRRWRIPAKKYTFLLFESDWYKYKLDRRIFVLGINNDSIFEVRKNIIQNHFDFCEDIFEF